MPPEQDRWDFVKFSGEADDFGSRISVLHANILQVKEETLSPTWDQTLVMENVILYGRAEELKDDPPVVIVEIFDQDIVVGVKSMVEWSSPVLHELASVVLVLIIGLPGLLGNLSARLPYFRRPARTSASAESARHITRFI